MPQTIEAIQHAKAAEVPLVVAVNKIDRENADLDRVRNELSQHEVIPEDWGGEHLFVNVSALKGDGVSDLLDAILLQAEVMDLKAVADGPAHGLVIESSLEKGRGAVATLLVQAGTLKQGDMIIAGEEYGRIRNMFDEKQQSIKSAGPSSPAVVLGLSKTPSAGDDFLVVKNERKAREVAEFRQSKAREAKLASQQASKLEDMFTDQVGCSRQRGSASRRTDEALERRGKGQGAEFGRWRNYRDGRKPCCGIQRRDHWLQRTCRRSGQIGYQGIRRRYSLLQHHLRSD